MLLHDFRFANWSLKTFLRRYHFAKAYAKYLGKLGHEVSLLIFHQDVKKPKVCNKSDYLLHVLPSNLYFPPFLRFGNEHSTILFRYIKELMRNADIIHIHNYWLWSFPYTVLLIKQFCKDSRIVVQYHGETDKSKVIRAIAFRKIYECPDIFLVARDSEISFLRKYLFKGQQANKIIKFPNVGAESSIFRPIEKKSDIPSVIYTGRIIHERRNKFPFLILRLAKERALKDIMFYIVGDGPLLEPFRKYRYMHKLTNVHITGYLPVSHVARLMSKCWLYFYPGFLENADGYWDGAVKEALLCGTPTIALNSDAKQRRIIKDSMGFLLPSNSFKAVVQGLRVLLTYQREEVLRKSDEVLKKAKFFSWENVIKKLEKLYKMVCSDKETKNIHEV